MIHVERGPVPKILQDSRYAQVMEEARSFHSIPQAKRRQKRFTFPWFGRSSLVEALLENFRGRCAYCEMPVEAKEMTIDHFRPRSNAMDLKGKVDPDHYWGIVYAWSNLYPSCPRCNASKRNAFPVRGRRAPADADEKGVRAEKRMLIDPCEDEPLHHLRFAPDGTVEAVDEMGRITLELLELNRSHLARSRAATFEVLDHALAKLTPGAKTNLRSLRLYLDPGHGFLGARRSRVAQRLLEARPDLSYVEAVDLTAEPTRFLREFDATPAPRRATRKKKASRRKKGAVAPPSTPPPSPVSLTRATQREQLHRIEITNFRAIDHLELEFPLESREPTIQQTSNVETVSEDLASPWLCLLGENGCGKSTVLQAVATALMTDAERRKLDIGVKDVLRWGESAGQVKLWFSGGGEPLVLEFRKSTGRFRRHGACPIPMVIGYGTTRLLPRGRHRPAKPGRRSHLVPLFNPFTPLVDGKQWMRDAGNERFDYAARVLKDLLQLDEESSFTRKRRGGRINFQLQGQETELETLSSGYQSLIALTTDVMNALSRQSMIMEAAQGLVLLDEIGVHLHPQWRMRVVGALRAAFPGVQFLASTHEPLCLRGLRSGEVVVMRRENARVFALDDLPPVEELRVDQLLTSEYFGLHTAMDPDMEDAFAEYYRLKALPAKKRSTDQKERLGELEDLLARREHLGSTRRQRMLYGAIDEFLATESREPDPQARPARKKELSRKLRKLWEEA